MKHCPCPEVNLREDDPTAMGILLGVLHFRKSSEAISMDAQSLATLSIHCDKYDCFKALRPWVFAWFRNFQSRQSVEDYGHLLLAAHFFRSTEHFSGMIKRAQLHLPPGFSAKWETSDILNMLPGAIISKFLQYESSDSF